MLDIKQHEHGVSFKVRVQPRASKNQLAGMYEDALKLRLTAPPVDGEANQACIEYFAKLFKVSKSQVNIEQGHTGRSKVIAVNGVNIEEAKKILKLK